MQQLNKVKKHFNNAQLLNMAIAAHDTTIIGSRGIGKTEGLDAPFALKMVNVMPKSNGAILSPTYSKLMSNTLPSFCAALASFGYYRNIHYFIGEKAPKKLGFQKPYIEPIDWHYAMHWYMGSVINLISFDRPMSVNSMSLDWVLGMEAKFLNKTKIDDEVVAANRGDKYFSYCPWHHATHYSSDQPTNASGKWLLEREKLMDPELIYFIKDTYREYMLTKQKEESEYNLRKLKDLRRQLGEARTMAHYFAEFDIFENIELIGEKRIAEFKRELPPLIFRTAILNERIRKVANGFYSSLDEKKHYYDKYNNSYIESLGYDFDKTTSVDCRFDGDTANDKPLRIALDYNAAINSLVCGQVINNELRTLKSFYVKTPKKLSDVVQDFCDYYSYHQCKQVIFYYDHTTTWTNAIDDNTYSEVVMSVLRRNGWGVLDVYIGQQMRHDQRHHHINEALKGNGKYYALRFNRQHNEYLLLAMENAGIKVGPKGFQKDKSAEKYLDSPENPDETKTHITDAWDSLFIGSFFFALDSIAGYTATQIY